MHRRKHLNEKLISKYEINIKDTLKKKPMYSEIKCQPLNDGYTKTPQQGKLENMTE